ncbi:MAG TPA: retropepsin-like aspartic protease [Candidatus Udaeobacter sp.]|nr:retropepsin-like aspartic protease [Candidatus Udaeobacter sp.]
MRILRLTWLVLFVFVLAPYQRLSAAEPNSDIPFRLYEGFAMVVRGSIGGQTGLNFLFDTGAVPTAIHQRLAQSLNIHGKREAIALGAETSSVERVQVRELRLEGSTEQRMVSAVVVDLTPIEVRLRVRLDAVIGLDVLKQDFTIDYREKRIRFGPPNANGQAVPFELRYQAGAPYIVVLCEIDSDVLSLLLDTANDSLTLFRTKSQAGATGLRKVRASETVDAQGRHPTLRAELRSLRFGSSEWSDVAATVITSMDASAMRDFDGMLGPTSLGITRIGFDFAKKTMFVEFKK